MQNILITEKSTYYELLDSGEGEKLERYGGVVISRPDPQALWLKRLSKEEWANAHATFTRMGTTGKWEMHKEVSEDWRVSLEGLNFKLKLLPSKHIGVFPEQSISWKWLEEKIKKETDAGRKVFALNLFGYTGGATLACVKAGAEVCHLDASKFAVDFAVQNLKNSKLGDKPVRFIVDDARKFIEREIKRGNKYDVILMDPPVYGKGTKDEVWKLEEDLLPFVLRIKQILSENPLAIVINGYAAGYSSMTYEQVLKTITSDLIGKISSGELAIRESGSERILPCGIYARFESLL